MDPSKKEESPKLTKLSDFLGGRSIVLCPGISGSSDFDGLKLGAFKSELVDNLLVDDDDVQEQVKLKSAHEVLEHDVKVGIFGSRSRTGRALQAAGSMIAPGDMSNIRSPLRSAIMSGLTPGMPSGSLKPVTDARGLLRCPPGTPNANQFTDMRLTGCMDMPGTPRRTALGTQKIGQSRIGAATRQVMYGRGPAPTKPPRQVAIETLHGVFKMGAAKRRNAIIQKYGPLATIEEQSSALRKAFPSVKIDFKDRFYTRITPTGRAKITNARREFVIGLLSEAEEFPDVAQHVSHISDRLGLIKGRAAFAATLFKSDNNSDGIEIHMSQWAATSLGEIAVRSAGSTAKKKQDDLKTFFSNGIDEKTDSSDAWHHVATHEFGHAVDIVQFLEDAGIDGVFDKDGKLAGYEKVRPSKNQAAEAAFTAINDNEDRKAKDYEDWFSNLLNSWFSRSLSAQEQQTLADFLGSAYADSFSNKNDGSLVEYAAELFAQIRISGYGSEIPAKAGGDIIPPQIRDILFKIFGRQISGADDASGGMPRGQIGMKMEFAEIDTKGAFGRFRRLVPGLRPRRFRRAEGMIDGDNDGFVTNPLTGRDDKPAPRRMINKPAIDLYRQSRNRVSSQRFENDDDIDPLEELLGRAGVGKIPSKPNLPSNRSESARTYSPVSVDRKRVKIDNISPHEFLTFMDDLIDYRETISEDDIGERDWKRIGKLLFAMQKIDALANLKNTGTGINIGISEDELKRLVKGLDSLLSGDGPLADNEIAKNLHEQLKKLYKKPWSSIKDEPLEKRIAVAIEQKGLGKRISTSVRKIGRRFNPSKIDGDGDGFRTNPLTGEDNVPVVNVPDMPKPSSGRSVVDRALTASYRTRQNNIRRGLRGGRLFGPSIGFVDEEDMKAGMRRMLLGQYSKSEAVQRVRSIMAQSNIKDRDWATFDKRISQIEKDLSDKFGKLETLSDFKAAFKKVHPNVKLDHKFSGSDELTIDEQSFLKGTLWTMDKFNKRFSQAGVIKFKRVEHDGTAGGSTSDKSKVTFKNGKLLPKIYSGPAITFRFTQYEMHRDKAVQVSGYLDNIGTQAEKAFLKHVDSNQPDLTPDEIYDELAHISGLNVGIHEAGHGLHLISSHVDALPEDMTPEEAVSQVWEFMQDNEDKIIEGIHTRAGIDILHKLREAQFITSQPFPTKQEVADEMNNPNNPPQVLDALQDLLDNYDEKKEKYDAAVEFAQTMSQILNGPNQQKYAPMAQPYLSASKPQDIDAIAFSHRDELIAMSMELASLVSEGMDIDAINRELLTSETGFAWALHYMIGKRMWDDLTSQEISAVRDSLKYVSSYAKDKNSFYDGRFYLTSIEGAAEAFALRVMGFDVPQNKVPLSSAAISKWLNWMFGENNG